MNTMNTGRKHFGNTLIPCVIFRSNFPNRSSVWPARLFQNSSIVGDKNATSTINTPFKIGNKTYVFSSGLASSPLHKIVVKHKRNGSSGMKTVRITETKCLEEGTGLYMDAVWSERICPETFNPVLLKTEETIAHGPTKIPRYISNRTKHILSFPLFNEKKQFMPLKPEKPIYDASNLEVKYPHAAGILNATIPNSKLQRIALWEEKRIRKLGLDGFKESKEDNKQDSRDMHTLIKEFLKDGNETFSVVNSSMELCWKSLKPIMGNISETHCLDTKVVHPYLRYSGHLDCIAIYNSKPAFLLWRRSQRPVDSLNFCRDSPLYLMAYLGALNFDPAYKYQIRDCYVIVVSGTGAPAVALYLRENDMKIYWNRWLRRLKAYYSLKEKLCLSSVNLCRSKLNENRNRQPLSKNVDEGKLEEECDRQSVQNSKDMFSSTEKVCQTQECETKHSVPLYRNFFKKIMKFWK